MSTENTKVYLDVREGVQGDTTFVVTQMLKRPPAAMDIRSLYLSEEQARELYFALQERLNNL